MGASLKLPFLLFYSYLLTKASPSSFFCIQPISSQSVIFFDIFFGSL